MKAMTYTHYGTPDVLELKQIDIPTPKDDEVLVKIRAAGINMADWYGLLGNPFLVRFYTGLRHPNHPIPGADVAGQVEAVGKNVTLFKPGDEVFGDLSSAGLGGYAEYAVVPEKFLVLKPSKVSFEEAAAVPMAAITALQALRDHGAIQAGQKVLINGASGGVGTFAVQIAKAFGAEVTAVCSTRHIEAMRSLGADHIIDYTREDVTRGNQHFDLIIAANGSHAPGDYKRILVEGGRCVVTGGTMGQIFKGMLLGPLMSRGGKKIGSMTAKSSQADLTILSDWMEAGKIRPVVDRCFSLDETADALRYFHDGHPTGKVIIVMM